jgi:hypothetical protein
VANEACSSSSHLATSARPSSSRLRTRSYADSDPSSAFSLLRTGAPSSSTHTANFRATFARLQNIESFRQRAATDESLKNPDPFKSRLAPPPSRPGGSSPDKASAGGAGGSVYESRPNSPTGKAGGKRRASNAAPGDEEDGAPKKKASGGKKKKKKVPPADGESTVGKDAATPASPGKDAATPVGAPAKKKAPSKKKKKDADAATEGGDSTAAPTPAASEIDETKPTTAKKAPAKSKKKAQPAAATAAAAAGTPASSAAPATPVAGFSPLPPNVSQKTLPMGSVAASIAVPQAPPIGLPQSFATHVQQAQVPFALALPTNAGTQQVPTHAAQLVHLQAQLERARQNR